MYCNDLQYMRITSLAPLATCKVYTANCCGIILNLLLTATNKKNTVDCMHSVCIHVCMQLSPDSVKESYYLHRLSLNHRHKRRCLLLPSQSR